MLPRKIGATSAPCRQSVSPGQRRKDKPWGVKGQPGEDSSAARVWGTRPVIPPRCAAGGHPSALRGIAFFRRQGRGVINSAALTFARMFHELCTNRRKIEPLADEQVSRTGPAPPCARQRSEVSLTTRFSGTSRAADAADACAQLRSPDGRDARRPSVRPGGNGLREVATVPPARFTLITSRAKGHAAGRRILTGRFLGRFGHNQGSSAICSALEAGYHQFPAPGWTLGSDASARGCRC